ncbi:MAG: hypothetical protein HC913_10555 [Microscillaceae bacterium]|nr:hypothetical protein [Microscillaceae bacterium]
MQAYFFDFPLLAPHQKYDEVEFYGFKHQVINTHPSIEAILEKNKYAKLASQEYEELKKHGSTHSFSN